jgi:hypothetical protein
VGIKDHDDLLTQSALTVNEAIKILSTPDGSWGFALQSVENVIDDLGKFAYDDRFSTPMAGAFKHPPPGAK